MRGALAANQKDANQRRKIRTRSRAGDAEQASTDLCKRKEGRAERARPGSQGPAMPGRETRWGRGVMAQLPPRDSNRQGAALRVAGGEAKTLMTSK